MRVDERTFVKKLTNKNCKSPAGSGTLTYTPPVISDACRKVILACNLIIVYVYVCGDGWVGGCMCVCVCECAPVAENRSPAIKHRNQLEHSAMN